MPDLSHTVVVIEEDHATRMFLADNLTADGFDVHPTGDPGHALALCPASARTPRSSTSTVAAGARSRAWSAVASVATSTTACR